MAEAVAGLAVASSIISVVQITGKILQIGWDCVRIYQGAAPEEMERLLEELTLLHGLLITLKTRFEIAQTEQNLDDLAVLQMLQCPNGVLVLCTDTLNEVSTILEEIIHHRGARLKVALKSLRMSKILRSLVDRLESFKSCLLIACHSDQLVFSTKIQQWMSTYLDSCRFHQEHVNIAVTKVDENVESLRCAVRQKFEEDRLLRQEKKARKALCWLNAPDFRANHLNARKLAQPGTGLWFVEGSDFQSWTTSSQVALWLYAIPGAGKTILCSTAIESITSRNLQQYSVAVVYFYFDFRDLEKQTTSSMLTSLLHQLASKLPAVPEEIFVLYDKYKGGKSPATEEELMQVFIVICRRYFERTYVFVDALDECKEASVLLPIIRKISTSEGIWLMISSRNEQHLITGLAGYRMIEASLTISEVALDVQLFVTQHLAAEPYLRNLSTDLKADITEHLVDGARGIADPRKLRFRWVKCQLDTVQTLRRPKAIRKALSSLPVTLDETYERILTAVSSEDERFCLRRVLHLVIYGSRPMTLAEVAEAAVIDIGGRRLDPEDRFTLPEDLFSGWQSLFIFTGGCLGLAHFSLQEYLLSDRIRSGPAEFFAMDAYEAAQDLALISLTYISYEDFRGGPCEDDEQMEQRLSQYPFLDYAANNWFKHCAENSIQENALELFDRIWTCCSSPQWLSWLQMYCDQAVTMQRTFDTYQTTSPSLLYFPAFWGLCRMCEHLLQKGVSLDEHGGYFGCPLQAAVIQKHKAVVELLLGSRAAVNQKCGYHGTTLQAAANVGSTEIAKLLLQHGADPQAPGGVYGNPLQSAARSGHTEVVDLLIEHGANVNAQGGPFGNPLQAASNNGHFETAQLLIKRGALVNAQGGAFGNALQAASLNGRCAIVEMLLQNGADVNIQNGLYSNALLAASLNGHDAVVKVLLDHGADVHKKNGEYDNALQAAAINGHEDVVSILLEYGADVHSKGGRCGNALNAAARNGYLNVVSQILQSKPELNTDEGYYGSPLQAAARNGFIDVAKELLAHDASANTQGGRYGNPLQAAASNGKSDIVALLLEHGAEVNRCGGPYHTALTAAAAFGHEETVRKLLAAGADVSLSGGKYATAINAARVNGRYAVANLLEEHGKDARSVEISTVSSNQYCEEFGPESQGYGEVVGQGNETLKCMNCLLDVQLDECPRSEQVTSTYEQAAHLEQPGRRGAVLLTGTSGINCPAT